MDSMWKPTLDSGRRGILNALLFGSQTVSLGLLSRKVSILLIEAVLDEEGKQHKETSKQQLVDQEKLEFLVEVAIFILTHRTVPRFQVHSSIRRSQRTRYPGANTSAL